MGTWCGTSFDAMRLLGEDSERVRSATYRGCVEIRRLHGSTGQDGGRGWTGSLCCCRAHVSMELELRRRSLLSTGEGPLEGYPWRIAHRWISREAFLQVIQLWSLIPFLVDQKNPLSNARRCRSYRSGALAEKSASLVSGVLERY